MASRSGQVVARWSALFGGTGYTRGIPEEPVKVPAAWAREKRAHTSPCRQQAQLNVTAPCSEHNDLKPSQVRRRAEQGGTLMQRHWEMLPLRPHHARTSPRGLVQVQIAMQRHGGAVGAWERGTGSWLSVEEGASTISQTSDLSVPGRPPPFHPSPSHG